MATGELPPEEAPADGVATKPEWEEMENPFFQRMPVVLMARAVRRLGGEEVYTPDTKSKRVWGRMKASRAAPNGRKDQDYITATGSLAQLRNLDDLAPY